MGLYIYKPINPIELIILVDEREKLIEYFSQLSRPKITFFHKMRRVVTNE